MDTTQESERYITVIESAGEKLANAITHGLGLVLSLLGFSILIINALAYTDYIRVVSVLIYGFSLCSLFLASTLYHSVRSSRARRTFQIIDHCAIYWLIAGTYTPILLLGIQGELGYFLLLFIWALALLGTFFKLFFWYQLQKLSSLLYITMGWLALAIAYPLMHSLTLNSLVFLSVGGFIYTLGIWFFNRDHIPYNHATWHVFVLAGSFCHFIAIYQCVVPYS